MSSSNTKTSTTYDSIPYISYPFPYTRPEHIMSVASVFGLEPPKVNTARVLELGSSEGMGLIPFACSNPSSYSIGIDISKVEVEHANQTAKAIGLKNIEFKHMSVEDIDEKLGKFDYIICHGLYSWINHKLQDKILSICSNNLNKNGLAFISYNTFPGWNMANIVRDMMQFHASTFQENTDKLTQAKALVAFVQESLANSSTPFANFLKQEADFITKKQDSYIFHEYVEGHNHPIYFHQFVDLIRAKSLNYVCDTTISTMFSGNLTPQAAAMISKVPDIIRSEQYIDFINNRRFRCSVICHQDQKINYNINPDALDKFYVSLNIKPLKQDQSSETFYLNGNQEITITTIDPSMKVMLHILSELENYPTKVKDIVKLALEKLPSASSEDLAINFKNQMIQLLFNGYLQITATKPDYINTVSKKPKASELARYQAAKSAADITWVANQKSEVVYINIFEKHLLQHLDGTNTEKDLIQKLKQDLLEKKFSILIDNNPIKDEANLDKHLTDIIKQSIQNFKKSGLCIA